MDLGTPAGDVWDPMLPAALAVSRIWAAGGYQAITGFISPEWLELLRTEAVAVRATGTRALVAHSDATESRGGSPARAFRSAAGGACHWGLHSSSQMIEALGNLCNIAVTPSGAGTYSFYEEPGDFLALHRDVLRCDLTIVTCLSQHLVDDTGGGLLLYPSRVPQKLSAARAAGRSVGVPVPLRPGETALLLGGLVPHEVTPVAAGQDRIVAIHCYQLGEASPAAVA